MTLRAAIIADSHFDSSSRFEECIRVHDFIVDDCAARKVDVILHSGDVTERKSNPEERLAVARFLQRASDVAPVIIVRGNHDPLGDLAIYAKLKARHPIIVEEAAAVHVAGGFVVGCLAWPSKAAVLTMGAQSHQEGELLAGEALRNVLRGLGQEMDTVAFNMGREGSLPKILLAHAMVRGSKVSTGQPLVGCDLELGVEDLSLAGASFVALGHIHRGQDWSLGSLPTPVVYPGSPRRTSFGETEVKGYVIAEFEGDECVDWQLVPTPCAPMLLLQDEWGDIFDDGRMRGWRVGDGPEDDVKGAEVRFRYRVPADMRDEARDAAELLRGDLIARGAINVKLDPVVIPTTVARAPEVAAATTLEGKMRALWASRGTTPDDARAERLLTKVRQLEEAVRGQL